MAIGRIGSIILLSTSLTFSYTSWSQEISQGDETQQMAPAPAKDLPTATHKATVFTRAGVVSRQVNINAQGNNIVGDAANEPSIAVDPSNTNRMAVGWRQFGSISSSFRQAGWAYSHDGGQTWISPGAIEPSVFRSDPVLGADRNGVFYYNSLSSETGTFRCTVFRSFDGGVTWDFGTLAHGGDKQWMAIDRSPVRMGQGNIYSNWNISFSSCSGDLTASYDGGKTYVNCINIPSNPRWGTIDFGPKGEVYFAGVFANGTGIAKSSNLLNSSVAPTFDFNNNVDLGGEVRASVGPNPQGLMGQVYVTADLTAGKNAGFVYLLASVDPPGPDPADVMLARSEDGGQTWQPPVRINDDPPGTNAWQWLAMMDVSPTGRIDAFWNDTRANPGTFLSEFFYSYSLDGGKTWSTNVALSPTFDPHQGWPQQSKMGDYNDVFSHYNFVDAIYTATLGGEQNIYHLRVNLGECPADLNSDFTVDEADLLLAYPHWATFDTLGDVDENGVVDIRDLITILNSAGGCL